MAPSTTPPAPRWPAILLASAASLAALGACALALEEPRRPTVEDMDMGMLQRSLLKIYVCGKESTIHEQKLEEIRLAMEHWGTPDHPRQREMTPDQVKAMEDRHKFIFNYMLAEKTNAIQMIHIADRVLGTEVHLQGEGRPERAILEKRVELIEVPRGTEMRAAGKIISEALGCPVRVETIDEVRRIWFTMGPTTGEAIIKHVCAVAPFDYRIENGVVIFRHRDLGKAAPETPGLDDEEKKAGEEERNRKK